MTVRGEVEAAVRRELRSMGVSVSSVRGAQLVNLARRLDDPERGGAAALSARIGRLLEECRSLRVSAPETAGPDPAPEPVAPVDPLAKARAAREARASAGR